MNYAALNIKRVAEGLPLCAAVVAKRHGVNLAKIVRRASANES